MTGSGTGFSAQSMRPSPAKMGTCMVVGGDFVVMERVRYRMGMTGGCLCDAKPVVGGPTSPANGATNSRSVAGPTS